jgi:ubiquitin thioesterase OTU1
MAAEKPLKLQIIRLPSRERHIIPSLPPSSSLSALQSIIAEKLSLPTSQQALFNGFPPKEIELDSEEKRQRTLTDAGIKNGDTVEVRVREAAGAVEQKEELKQGKGWEYPPTVEKGSMVRRDMPRDNSCLFHSIAYVCSNKGTGVAAAAAIREIVANLVASDPAKYSTAFLASPNHLYQQHIMNPDTWGGGIELSILSTHYQTEIVAFDFRHLREDVFGRGDGYKRRVFLIYTGDHYDALVWQPAAGGGAEQQVFSTKDDNAWLRGARQARQQECREGESEEGQRDEGGKEERGGEGEGRGGEQGERREDQRDQSRDNNKHGRWDGNEQRGRDDHRRRRGLEVQPLHAAQHADHADLRRMRRAVAFL